MVKPSEKCNEYWQQSFKNIVSYPTLNEEQRDLIDNIVYEIQENDVTPYSILEMTSEKWDALILMFIYLATTIPHFRVGLFSPNISDLPKIQKNILDCCLDAKPKLQSQLNLYSHYGLRFLNESYILISAATELSNIEGLTVDLAVIVDCKNVSKNVNGKIMDSILATDGKVIKVG